MSNDFEKRVKAATGQLLNDRYKILRKLDPELADIYAVGINKNNQQRIDAGRPLTGFGKISKDDVDDIMEAALDDWGITKEEEEALLIILETRSALAWETGAKEYMIERLEANLDELWSSVRIDDEVFALLQWTAKLDFVSAGDRHKGTGHHYTPLEYQVVANLVDRLKIGAWEVSARRTYLRTDAGRRGAWGLYDAVTNDIYIIKGLASTDRKTSFTHEATHALQDFRNFATNRSIAKFVEADAYIAQAFVALEMNVPYTGQNRPEDVACRTQPTPGAARLLQTPLRSRDAAWKTAFKTAYDDVVDAFAAQAGSMAEDIIDVLEGGREQKREDKFFQRALRKLKKKRP